MTTITPSEKDLRSMLSEGQTLYTISRQFNTTIPEIFKLGRSYGIHFAYDHNCIPKPTKEDLESMPWEPALPLLSYKIFPDYQQEAIPCLG